METGFQLLPEQASSFASSVDHVHFFVLTVGLVFATLIASLLVVFSVLFRSRGPRGGVKARAGAHVHGSLRLEILWTAIPLALTMGMFFWGARIYLRVRTPPAEGMQVRVTAKQWMWKLQHPTGQREIGELHVPVGRNVILTMISEDVIHDFYVPAFRVKQDVLPGQYTQLWFRATKTGRYHLFCAEYCGAKHSEMIGEVIVMEPAEYEQWLTGRPATKDPAEAGKELFEKLRCDTCHAAGPTQRGPSLVGLAGSEVHLKDGRTVTADEAYLRESILEPAGALTAGYEPLMPTYKGQIGEEEILALIAYIQSLAPAAGGRSGGDGK